MCMCTTLENGVQGDASLATVAYLASMATGGCKPRYGGLPCCNGVQGDASLATVAYLAAIATRGEGREALVTNVGGVVWREGSM